MANPLIDQGQLNRLKASVTFPGNPSLNVTPSFLAPEAIRMALEGEATAQLPSLTGVVQSPEPYQMVTVTIHLLKSQALANAFKSQYETSTVLGELVIRPDSTILNAYDLTNGALEAIEPLDFSGRAANFTVRIRAQYNINANLWN